MSDGINNKKTWRDDDRLLIKFNYIFNLLSCEMCKLKFSFFNYSSNPLICLNLEISSSLGIGPIKISIRIISSA
jgi:hypothetical protein